MKCTEVPTPALGQRRRRPRRASRLGSTTRTGVQVPGVDARDRRRAGAAARSPGRSASSASYRAAMLRPALAATPASARSWAAADRGLQVGHVGLEAGLDDVVAPAAAGQVAAPGVRRHAVQPGPAQPVGTVGVVGGDHAALADREVLGGVEAEADGASRARPSGTRTRSRGRARRPRRPGRAGAPRPRRARPRRAGRRPSARRPSPPAPPQPRSSRRAVVSGVGIPVTGVDVDQHGPQPGVHDRLHGAAEGHRRRSAPVPPAGSRRSGARARARPCTRRPRPRARAPTYAANSASNAATSGPVVTQPDSRTRCAARREPAAMWQSAKGIRSGAGAEASWVVMSTDARSAGGPANRLSGVSGLRHSHDRQWTPGRIRRRGPGDPGPR